MPINDQNKYIFVHIPKTGGTSIEKSLGITNVENLYVPKFGVYDFDGIKYSPQHLTLSLIKEIKPHTINYKSFTITRHPYEKAVSAYFWLNHKLYNNPKNNLNDFEEFLEETYFHPTLDHCIPQHQFIDESIGLIIDLDDLNNKWPLICEYLEIPFVKLLSENRRLPKKQIFNLNFLKKKITTQKLVKNLSAHIKNKIYNVFREDFEKFNYSKRYLK